MEPGTSILIFYIQRFSAHNFLCHVLVHILYLIHFSSTWRTQTRNMTRSSDWSVVRKTRNMARTSDWSIKRFWIKMFRHTLKGVKVVTSYAVPTFRKLWFPLIGKSFVLKPPFLSIFQSITVQSPSLDLICQKKLTLFSRESSKVVVKRDQHPWAALEKSCETTRRDHWEVVCYWGIISDQW